jgi:hypothetical protein
MTMAIEDTRVDEEEEAFHSRIDALEDAIMAMISAAHIHDDGEAMAALINCVGNVVRSTECTDCRNDLVETAIGHFNGIIEDIRREPASESGEAPSGHVH